MENFIFFNFNAAVWREKNISTANLSPRNVHPSRNQIKRKLAIVNERENGICLRNMKLEKTRKWGAKLDELVKVQVNHEESKQSSQISFHHTESFKFYGTFGSIQSVEEKELHHERTYSATHCISENLMQRNRREFKPQAPFRH